MKRKILYLGNKLAHKGYTPTSIDTLGPKLESLNYELKYASSEVSKTLRLFHMVLSIIKNRNWVDYVLIDTYSTQNFWYAWASSIICRLFKLKYIPVLHGGNLPNRLKSNPKISKSIFSNSFINISPSLYLQVEFKKEGYPIIYIPNAIEINKYTFKKRSKMRPKLLWVRSFAKLYNPLLALQIVENLQSTFPGIELCMVGPDKDGSLEHCKAYTKAHKLPVLFTGKLSKPEWIKLSEDYDIFINTTHFDNLPVSILEAMALGLPVVSTNVGGIPYLITDEKNGILVEDNDLEGFIHKIKILISQYQYGIEICENARFFSESFSWEHVKNKWLKTLI